ncbi:MAG: response regulator [Anaerolineales bacterium]|nr:response regulator [Anaerolineales bacterium]MCZ2121500.1 response regulator [Anaerolineales bacterium]
MPEKNILIVDADVASRNFIARNLVAQKYQVLQAGSGKEGLISAWRDRPDLIIIDPTLPDLKGEEISAKLRQDARTKDIPLIALSGDPSVLRIKSCLDAGFNEYITKSGQAVATLNETVNRLLGITAATAREGGLLIVFASAKGGAGTSSLCANIAMNISQTQPEAKVALVDLVLPMGSIAPLVGYLGQQNIVTVADIPPLEMKPDYFETELPEIPLWKFNLLAGSPDPESGNRLNVARIWDIVAGIKSAFDYVLVDLGRSLSKISLPLLQHADLIALIVSTDLSAVHSAKILLDYLKNKGVRENAIFTILNRAVGLEGASKPDAEKILEMPIKATIPYLSGNFALANNQRQPYSLKFPKETAAFIFAETAREITALAYKMRTE